MNFKIIIIILILSVYACNKNKIENDDNLIGSWIEESRIDDSLIEYKKVNELIDSKYGFSFNSKGLFIERNIAGRCATPPIGYANYEGTWERTDSIIDIEVAYWGGLGVEYKWEIVSLNSNKLQIVKIEQEYYETV